MMSQSQSYIIEENKRLQKENEELREKAKDYEEEIESCTNDEKTIGNLRSLLHNLTSISNHRNEMVIMYEEQRTKTIDYIRDYNLSQNLHIFSFSVFLTIAFLLNFKFIYAVVFLGVLEIYINTISLAKFEHSLKNTSSKIFDKQKVCAKELKNMEIFDQLIDAV